MARAFVLPDLGEGLTEAEIVKVLVQEGDLVQEDAPLLEVETDKATVEIPSPLTGRVTQIHVHPGQTVKVGAVLVTFDEEGGRSPFPAPSPTRAPSSSTPPTPSHVGHVPATPAPRRPARQLGVDLRTVRRGTGPGRRRSAGPARPRWLTARRRSSLRRAAALALVEHTQFTASLDPAAGELVLKGYSPLGVAVATDRGLIGTVIREVDRKPLPELQRELA